LEERHVTRAGNRCFLSQSAMSRAFERLRVRQRGTGQITGKAKEDEN
jgi:DNA-binding transcriptional LysR family regulator